MNINKPICGFRLCRKNLDGNCSNEDVFKTCEYQLLKQSCSTPISNSEQYRYVCCYDCAHLHEASYICQNCDMGDKYKSNLNKYNWWGR